MMRDTWGWGCCWLFFLLLALLLGGAAFGNGANVSYDGRSLIIDGKHKILFSGSIHYPRSTPEMWPSLISKAKGGGLDVIETLVFWNLHEPRQGEYRFSGNLDLVRFIKEIQAQGLYACIRIGPFIGSELSYGGFPFWLREIPGIVFRTDNNAFKNHMQNWVTKIVNMLKEQKLFASQGEPIILAQIENEYQNIEHIFGDAGRAYVRWAAQMAVGLQTGVPWVMGNQDDAPDPVINTCNGRECGETFLGTKSGPNTPHKPAIWTENWISFLQVYGEEPDIRSPEYIAFHVALFIAKRGSYVNYYMYHGGTNFGRTGSEYALTSHYVLAPLDEYGMLGQPIWGHLRELHAAVKLCLHSVAPGSISIKDLGDSQKAFVYWGNHNHCAAFLLNNGTGVSNVTFQNSTFELPPKSISILPDCKIEAFNTAKVSTRYSTRGVVASQKLDSKTKWEQYMEPIPTIDSSFMTNYFVGQLSVTKDNTDYLWYTTRLQFGFDDTDYVISVNSSAHVLHAFVNGAFVGSSHGSFRNKIPFFQRKVTLKKGANNISLLSGMVGLPNQGAFLESKEAGILSGMFVRIGKQIQDDSSSSDAWGYQVGLVGEYFQIHTDPGSKNVQWSAYQGSTHQRLTWYKTLFDAPAGNESLALNLASMGKGQAWINGNHIGRYWVSFQAPNANPSQTWYHVPRSFLKPTGNLLVILEEEEGDPFAISIDTVSITKVCAHVFDNYLPPIESWQGQNKTEDPNLSGRRPIVHLRCPPGKLISNILFSSYGTPSGDCATYDFGTCHSYFSLPVAEKNCHGKNECTIVVSSEEFRGDPCPGVRKSLLIDAQCA